MSDDPTQPTTVPESTPTEQPTTEPEPIIEPGPDADAIAAGHDRSNPSGIPDEGLEHTHQGVTTTIKREPQEVPTEHHEEGHEAPPQ